MSEIQSKIRLLTFTNLYPNPAQPAHGIFVERRLLRLVSHGGIEAIVVAPVPRAIGRYGRYRGIPNIELRDGLRVHHPRFLSIPGLGRFIAPFTMMLSSLRLIGRLIQSEGFDIVDAHYFYPDGVAAALLARVVGKPLVITARGTDVNLLPNYLFSRGLIKWAARQASAIITVSEALRRRLIDLGVSESKVVTLRNGVDTAEFAPRDQGSARKRLDLPRGTVLLSAGNLIEAKGHHLVIEALMQLPETHLVIAGEGSYSDALRAKAHTCGVSDRVRFAGVVDQDRLIDYYNAADILVLATLREGMPNVVLEALSCGLPVVATVVGGIAEVMTVPEMGILIDQRSADAVAKAVQELRSRYPSRDHTRSAGLQLGWACTIERQAELYREVVAGSR